MTLRDIEERLRRIEKLSSVNGDTLGEVIAEINELRRDIERERLLGDSK